MVRRAVGKICQSPEPPRIEELARDMRVSPRNLRRAFHEVVGLSPKAFTRIIRFQRALDAASDRAEVDWSEIAIQTGYYDQSHLIADFRALAGATPNSLPKYRPSPDPGSAR
jgi:AraC-like DNA-binding protein